MAYKISDYVESALELYVTHRIHPGSFVYAVLSNDLEEAVAHSDQWNEPILAELVAIIHTQIPAHLHGSSAIVQAHLNGETQCEIPE